MIRTILAAVLLGAAVTFGATHEYRAAALCCTASCILCAWVVCKSYRKP